MLDGACVGPMVDYIYHRKYGPREAAGPDGQPTRATPHEPNFTMKGRTAAALWQRVEEWHRQLAKESRKPPAQWERNDVGEFRRIEKDPATGETFCWTIQELLSSRELAEEGRAMNHCVASYGRSCAKRQISIWSMRVADLRRNTVRRVMTIEVQNARRFIAQARGRCNKVPGARHTGFRLNRAPAILKQWAEQEGLTIPAYI
jgi:hypothetical protein